MTRDPKRRTLPLTDADLERLAEIQPEHVDAARLWWHRYAAPGMRDLLDATAVPDPRAPDAQA